MRSIDLGAMPSPPPRQSFHQDVMIDTVEELLQVHVHHDRSPLGNILAGLSQGVMRPATRPETETRRTEHRIEQRLQHLQHRLLHQPVHHRWNAQLSHPTAGFGDLHPTDRLRTV